MTDVVDKKTRSRMMSDIRGKDTGPELLIRSGLHRRGIRYRLHDSRLPGKPDLVLRSRSAVIFVNGCFWHGHDCPLFKWPATRQDWWRTKIEDTRARDARIRVALTGSGWRQARVWECALKGPHRLQMIDIIDRLADWLDSDEPELDIHGTPVD
jgi:DNA mismatch endonuclease (patch repair protein)